MEGFEVLVDLAVDLHCTPEMQFKLARKLIPLLLIPFFACSNGDDSLDEELETSLRGIVTQNQEEFAIPGILAGVWIPDRGNLIIESGVSDLEAGTAISKDDHFRIGSLTKSFTVTVILQLAEDGLLNLEDPVSQYVPLVENGDATIAELANMRSGIFNYTEDGDFVAEFVQDFLRIWSEQELVDFANANAPYFPHGEGWHYSNTNTVILGMIVEQVTGNSLASEIGSRILKPLDLKETSYPDTPDLPTPFSLGYGFEPIEDISFADPSSSAGSGAMISRLNDLKIWGEVLGKGLLLSPDTQAQRIASLQPIVFSPCQDNDPDRPKRDCPDYDQYGYGFGEINGWIGHTGEYVGYTCLMMYEPITKSTVVILTNRFAVGAHVPTVIFREFAQLLNPLLGL